MRQKLLEMLYKNSFAFDPAFGFTLSSGKKSDVYIDAKKTVLAAGALELVGGLVFELIKDDPVDGVGGLTLGADPIAYAAAYTASLRGKPLDVFIVRKEPKAHGTGRWIEGGLGEGATVVIVEDVLTTGSSTIKAIERAQEAGFEIKRVVTLVDRQEGGSEAILQRFGLKVDSVFTKADLLEEHKKRSTT